MGKNTQTEKETVAPVTEEQTPAKAKVKTMADLEKQAAENLNYVTSDGTVKKQGEKVVKKVFGLTIETNY